MRIGVLLFIPFVMSTALADKQLNVDFTADFLGKYVWRGQNLNDDPVFQPSISLNYGSLTGCIWGNMDLTDYSGNRGEMTEYDYSLDYTTAYPGLDGIDFSAGVINYDCVSLDDTTELYVGFAIDLPLSPALTIYRDIDDINGTYAACSFNYDVENIASLSPEIPINMESCVCVGWGSKSFNTGYWDEPVTDSSISDLSFRIAFPVIIKNWTLSPNLNYVTILNSDMRKADTYNSASDYFYAGLNLSVAF